MDETIGAGAPLLLDGVLEDFRFTRMECLIVEGDPRTVYGAVWGTDLLDIHSPLFDLVTRARDITDRVRGHTHPQPGSMRLGDLFGAGAGQPDQPWVGLDREHGRELVFGAVGKVWRPSIVWHPVDAEGFPAFAEPGWAKIAASLVVHPYGRRRCLLSYEARTACTDAESARRFARYWAVVSPGAGVVMRTALRGIRAEAERKAPLAA